MNTELRTILEGVKEINSIHTSSFSNSAHFQFMKDICQRAQTEEALGMVGTINIARTIFAQTFSFEDKYYKLSQLSLVTADINDADRERDTLYSTIHAMITSLLKVPSAEMNRAARAIDAIMRNYDISPAMQLDKESAAIHNFVTDVKSKYSAELALLGMTTLVDKLDAANKLTQQLLLQRTNEKDLGTVGALREARTDCDKAYAYLVKLVNAIALTSTPAPYAGFIDFVNKEIKRYKEQAMAKKKKADDENMPPAPMN